MPKSETEKPELSVITIQCKCGSKAFTILSVQAIFVSDKMNPLLIATCTKCGDTMRFKEAY